MGDGKIKASIIIPHYNQKECLKRLFPHLAAQTYKDFEVIILDDCTPDESVITFIEDFAKDHPFLRLERNEVNLRFVRTCNRGIKLARGEYLCFLNADTELKPDFVEKNVEILDADPSIGGVTCSIVDHQGKNWFCGGKFEKGVPSNLKDDFEGIREVDFIAGTAAFYRRDVFDRIGLFDETYIMYHEDVEFGLRVKKKTDYRLCTFSDKLVTHLIVPSMPRVGVWYYGAKNLVLLSREYSPQYMANTMLHIAVYYVATHTYTSLHYAYLGILGAFDGILGRPARSYRIGAPW